MILPLLFVPLVYGISSTPDACAAPKGAGFGDPNATCWTQAINRYDYVTTCCWTEVDAEGIEISYCQHCDYDPATKTHGGCGEQTQVEALNPSPTPTPPLTGTLTPGNVQNLPTLEQAPTTTPPPLFGQDTSIPPTGDIAEQPLTAAPTQPTPSGVPTDPGSEEQPTTPQDDNQGGGVLPNIQNRPNIPSEGEITRQPEDDGQQEDSSEGAETEGPLT